MILDKRLRRYCTEKLVFSTLFVVKDQTLMQLGTRIYLALLNTFRRARLVVKNLRLVCLEQEFWNIAN